MTQLFALDDAKNLIPSDAHEWERISMGVNNDVNFEDTIKIVPSYHPRLGTKISVPMEWVFRLDTGATSRQIGFMYACQYSFNSSNAVTQVEQDFLVMSGNSAKVLGLLNGTYDASVLRNMYMKYALALTGSVLDLTYGNMNSYLEIYVDRS